MLQFQKVDLLSMVITERRGHELEDLFKVGVSETASTVTGQRSCPRGNNQKGTIDEATEVLGIFLVEVPSPKIRQHMCHTVAK